MALPILYPAQTNSHGTAIASSVLVNDTTIVVEDASILPDAPNLLVIGTEEDAETVLMTAKVGNSLTVQRGVEEIPRAWEAGEFIARNFTAKDHNDMIVAITEHADTLTPTAPGQVLASNEVEPGVYAASMRALELDDLLLPGAGPHNSIYRGKYLGDAPTAAQYAAISSGTFDDLYIGDYWTIGGVIYRIAGFDYYYNVGDAAFTAHHAVIVPDTSLYHAVMNATATTAGGYVGSLMRTTNLAQARTAINAAFAGHVASHRQMLTNAVDANGKASGWAWHDADVEIMNEVMVYGSSAWGESAYNNGYNVASSNAQLPLFALRHDLTHNRDSWWLRDVVSGTTFAIVHAVGHALDAGAAYSLGVRPAFSIIG